MVASRKNDSRDQRVFITTVVLIFGVLFALYLAGPWRPLAALGTRLGTVVESVPIHQAPPLTANTVEEPTYSSANRVSAAETRSYHDIRTRTKRYTVRKNDTLESIAKHFYRNGARWREIAEHNRNVIPDPNFLPTGAVLKIPGIQEPVLPDFPLAGQGGDVRKQRPPPMIPATTYIVKPGDSLYSIALKHYGNGSLNMTIYEANRHVIDDPDRLEVGAVLVLPAR